MKNIVSLCLLLGTLPLFATSSITNGYQTPPAELVALLDAPLPPDVDPSPDGTRLLLKTRRPLPLLSEVARPELRLAGIRFDAARMLNSRVRTYAGLSILDIETGEERPIQGMPKGMPGIVSWSPDGKHIAFVNASDDGATLWVIDAATAQARALTPPVLNLVLNRRLVWAGDSGSIYCLVRPPNPGMRPRAQVVPSGPNIQQTAGQKAAVRTYQDMLSSEHDAEVFAHYIRGQVGRIMLNGSMIRIGEPDSIADFAPSPDNRFVVTTTLRKPFSYLVPAWRFPRDIEIWTGAGRKIHTLAQLPAGESVPKGFDAVQTGPRNVSWRADAPATLVWVEAADGGNPRTKTDVRDRIFALEAPFKGKPVQMAALALRASGLDWGNGKLALVSERWRKNRATRTWIIQPDMPQAPPKLLFDRSSEDRYSDPGRPVMHMGEFGRNVLTVVDGGASLLYTGTGASPKGNIPFLDKRNLVTGKTERLWQSQAPYYERVQEVLDAKAGHLLTRRESVTEPPNFFLRKLDGSEPVALTHIPHPLPELAGVTKELVHYDREDGVKLTGTLYLPPGYKPEDGPLPMLMWAYPREFKSKSAASQVRSSPYSFTRLSTRGALPYLLTGYAVLDGPAMPIVGVGDDEPNDHFRRQLVSSARAAVKAMVDRGVADPDHIAVGGHSYGAFMVANLLAHSDLFQAGIARSGAYNRTLTPFGFQAEERTFWEAADVYGTMSPFFHAEKVDEPILLIHGEVDNNSGTYPLQSRRMFQAVKGLGGTARLVMLPHESHGYRARESMLHVLWEQWQWMEKYVKPKTSEADAKESF
ncbi:MAG: prolyl oligopeptidase family serine peptidase [Acidobacteriota bacterium]|nr:prolyl oligopeptidase family serine peptidase [Acidobacteriota bacterium]